MTESKKQNLFAKMVKLQTPPDTEALSPPAEAPPAVPPPSPAPVEARPKTTPAKKKPEPVKGKRDNPDYCQANAYVPKSLRRSVDKAIIDIDGLDYSTLVEDLLRKWLKSRGVSE